MKRSFRRFSLVLVPVVVAVVGIFAVSAIFAGDDLESAVYDFNNLTPTIVEAQISQDNWTHDRRTPTGSAVRITTDGFDGTNVMRFVVSGPSEGSSSSRMNNTDFSFPHFDGTERNAVIQVDTLSGFWGASFGLGIDTNGDNELRQVKGPVLLSELGPAIGWGVKCSARAYTLRPGSFTRAGTTAWNSISSIGCNNSDNAFPQEWVRFRLTMDFTANSGAGLGSLGYQNLSRGDSGFSPVAGNQNMNLGLDSSAADGRNPTLWNGMWFHFEGRPYAIDNIIVSRGELATAQLLNDRANSIDAALASIESKLDDGTTGLGAIAGDISNLLGSSVFNSANGHYYEAVNSGPIN